MKVKIEKSELFGAVKFPPSKSDSHRLIIAAALAEGCSTIENVSMCDDLLATMDSLSELGAKFEISGSTVKVFGADIKSARPMLPLQVRESGSTLRFLIPLAFLTGETVRFEGAMRLFERPLTVYEDIAEKRGFVFSLSEGGLEICGRLTGGDYALAGNISSQFISGMLFALPLADADSRIIIKPPFESRPYVEMTLSALRKFGIKARFTDDFIIEIAGNQKYSVADEIVEGDWSGGAFLVALRMLHPGIEIYGYDENSLQGDRVCVEYLEKIRSGYCELDISDCPDLGPILFAAAAYFGGAKFTGTRRLKIKESDRTEAMRQELEKLGARLHIEENSVTVTGGSLHAPDEPLSGHNDHRIVMSLAVLLTSLGGEINGAEAVKKSYPDFFEMLKKSGADTEIKND